MPLSPSGLATMADRLPLPHLALPFSPDLLWRYPAGLALSSPSPAAAAAAAAAAASGQHPHHAAAHHAQAPSSPHLDVKPQLPGALGE